MSRVLSIGNRGLAGRYSSRGWNTRTGANLSASSRALGRTFVPSEDMNEFTVHADTPQGTSIEGTTEIARNLVKEIGQIDGVSQIAYLAGADRYTHFHLFFYLLPSNERTITQTEIMSQVRRVVARHPAYAASIVGRNPLGGGGNFQIQAVLLGPRSEERRVGKECGWGRQTDH